MTKEDFIDICNKANVKGNTYDYTTKVLWIPEENWFIRIMYDISGDQLLPEDYEVGFNDYIDYKINVFTNSYDIMFEEEDGGIWLFNNEKGCDVQEETWNMLANEIFYNKEVPNVVWLEVNFDKGI